MAILGLAVGGTSLMLHFIINAKKVFYRFLASQDALEVMLVSESVSESVSDTVEPT